MKKKNIYLIFYFLFILQLIILPPQTRKIAKNLVSLSKLKKEILQYEKDAKNKSIFLQEKEALRKKNIELESRIISSQDLSSVSAYISEKAKQNAVEILKITSQNFQLIKETPESKFLYLPLLVEAKASFHNLACFLNYLEQGLYLLETKEIIIENNWPAHKIKMVICAIGKE